MTTGTVRLHRVLRTAPGMIYRAFLEQHALARWLPPNGFTATVHSIDPRVGGGYRMSFTHFASGHNHSFGGTYVELDPDRTIRYVSKFDDPGLSGEMETRVTLEAVSCGTSLHVVQSGIPASIPVEQCYLGWQESLLHLARLVEHAPPG